MDNFNYKKYLAEGKLHENTEEEIKAILTKSYPGAYSEDDFEEIINLYNTEYKDYKDVYGNLDGVEKSAFEFNYANNRDITTGMKPGMKASSKSSTSIDFPEMEDEFEGAMSSMSVSKEEFLQDIINASADEIVSDDYFEIKNAVEQGVYSKDEAVKLAKSWAKGKLSTLAEGKLLKEDINYINYDEFDDESDFKSFDDESDFKSLLELGAKATKLMGEDKLMKISDAFEERGDEQSDAIASHLNMAIELIQDGESISATPHLKKFNKACREALGELGESVNEGLPKGFWDKKIDAEDEDQDGKVDESYATIVNKIEKSGKSEKAAKAIAGAVASYKAKGGGKGPTAKQKSVNEEKSSIEKSSFTAGWDSYEENKNVEDAWEKYSTNTLQELKESLNPEVSKSFDRFIKAMAKRYEYSEEDAVFAIQAAIKQRGFESGVDGKPVNEVKGPIEKIELHIKKGESVNDLDQYGFDENVDGVPIEDLFDPTGRALIDMSIVYDQRGSMYLMDTEDIGRYH